MGIEFKWNKPPAQIASAIISDDVKKFAAAEWHRLYTPFVPMGDTGQLANNVVYIAEGSMGVIHHVVPYARYQYNGEGFTFRRDKHPLASAGWDKAAEAAGKKPELVQSLQGYIGGR